MGIVDSYQARYESHNPHKHAEIIGRENFRYEYQFWGVHKRYSNGKQNGRQILYAADSYQRQYVHQTDLK